MMIHKSRYKPRILHAPVVALYQPYLQSKGLRELGFEADYVILDQYDFSRFTFGWDDEIRSLEKGGRSRLLAFILKAAEKYDIIHFHSCFGFTANGHKFTDTYGPEPYADIRLFHRIGKVLCYQSWGCDARLRSIDIAYKYSTCLDCAPEIQEKHCDEDKKLFLNRMVEEYTDIRFGSADYAVTHPETVWTHNCIDLDFWNPALIQNIPEKFRVIPEQPDTVLIYHSFALDTVRGDVKGTKEIRYAVDRLRKEGYPVQFIFCNDVDFRDLRYYQVQADIVVDQLKCGSYGSTAVECMSMGKPVITYMRGDVRDLEPVTSPVINATPDTIYEVLKSLVLDREKRESLGRESRRFAEQVHDYRKVAQHLSRHYLNAWKKKNK